MVISLLFFPSLHDFASHIDREIVDAKDSLLHHTQKLNDSRKRYDLALSSNDQKPKNRNQNNASGNTKHVEIEGFRILVNPTPNYELSILDECIAPIHGKLEALERIKKHLLPSLKNCKEITVILEDGIPTAFMCYEVG